MQPQIRIIPRPWLVHHEKDFVPLRVEREQVDHIGVFDTRRRFPYVGQLIRHDS